ncbi:MAG TPA: N-acetyl sugar amidotransferase [Vicinamibacterales bacterium]|nr:N-acetyl sugar amidotransferase [Vicinamibacterales bacterium]
MRVGFVCTNYNNSALTRAAIESLRASASWNRVRAVIVDNHSQESDIAALHELVWQHPGVELILHPENAGYFPGLNIGINHLRTKHQDITHIVVGNNDLVFPANFVEKFDLHADVFHDWAVVAPDIVTPEGIHQNPHVLYPVSRARKLVWDAYYSSYPTGLLISKLAAMAKPFTARQETAPGGDLHRHSGPIAQGYGACYILGPLFFAHFRGLYAPTFLMQEEFFLQEQLSVIGQMTYYDPRFVVHHRGHASTDAIPSRHRWEIARDAHRVYKQYLASSVEERRLIMRAASRSAIMTGTGKQAPDGRGDPGTQQHMKKRPYQICTNCVMDTTDSKIVFDAQGVCDHCVTFRRKTLPNWHPDERGRRQLDALVERIKASGKGRDFDCILGMSGGIDSSYLTYLAKVELGLRPLVFHVDAGWNSQEAVNNIEQLVDGLKLDLFTEVIDWEEMRDLQLAFFKAGVPHIDWPQDLAFFATMYKFAHKYDVKYILTGANLSTECIRNPVEWMPFGDTVQLRDIHRRFGSRPLATFPLSNILWHKVYLAYVKRIRVVRPLNYMPYIKSDAMKLLVEKFGWQPYPQKHFESRFTRFYEGYWLPAKFGYDTRRVQFSSLIVTGQMTREQALDELTRPAIDEETATRDFEYVATKLRISNDELRGYLEAPKKGYRDYRSQEMVFRVGAAVMKGLGLEIGGKR